MYAEPFHSTIVGHIERVDDGLAQVFIGVQREEWFFPLETLPEGADVGREIVLTLQQGRYVALKLVPAVVRDQDRSIIDRLNRPMNLRRTGEMRRVELAEALRSAHAIGE